MQKLKVKCPHASLTSASEYRQYFVFKLEATVAEFCNVRAQGQSVSERSRAQTCNFLRTNKL